MSHPKPQMPEAPLLEKARALCDALEPDEFHLTKDALAALEDLRELIGEIGRARTRLYDWAEKSRKP